MKLFDFNSYVNQFHYHEAGNFVVNDFESDKNIDDVDPENEDDE